MFNANALLYQSVTFIYNLHLYIVMQIKHFMYSTVYCIYMEESTNSTLFEYSGKLTSDIL